MQERDRRKEKWAPRWFQPAKDTETFEGEYSLEDCPLWDFTGDYLKLARKAAETTGELLYILVCVLRPQKKLVIA